MEQLEQLCPNLKENLTVQLETEDFFVQLEKKGMYLGPFCIDGQIISLRSTTKKTNPHI